MGVDEIIVTWARTRGSTMKVLPVAAATASVICVMSASLKFVVMRPVCCAEATDTTAISTGAQRTKKRKQFTRDSPESRRTGATAMYQAAPPAAVAAADRAGLRPGRPFLRLPVPPAL